MSRSATCTIVFLARTRWPQGETQPPAPPFPGEQTRRARAAQPTSGRGPAMDTIAPATSARSTELRHRRDRLELGPAAAAYACGHVRRAISAWSVPVNPAVAILLTSDLVINAVANGAGETITLGIRWSSGQFRVEVHDASVAGDSWVTSEADANADSGLILAVSKSASW